MNASSVLQLGLLAALLFMALASAGSALAYPRLRARLASVAPAARTRWLLAWCSLPIACAVGFTALCFAPSALDVLWPGLDHCPHHGDGHPHLCLVHLGTASGDYVGWLIVVAAAMLAGFSALSRAMTMARSRAYLRQLSHTAVFDRARDVWVVESELPLALTCGLLRSRTLVSTALVEALPTPLLEAVIEHERAHACRRDVFWKAFAALVSLLHLPATRRSLLADLELAAEQACDEAAGRSLGDRVRVARALLAIERLLQGSPLRFGPAGVSFGGSSVAGRVESLLGDAVEPSPYTNTHRGLIAAGLFLLLALAAPLHHLIESLLGLITG